MYIFLFFKMVNRRNSRYVLCGEINQKSLCNIMTQEAIVPAQRIRRYGTVMTRLSNAKDFSVACKSLRSTFLMFDVKLFRMRREKK